MIAVQNQLERLQENAFSARLRPNENRQVSEPHLGVEYRTQVFDAKGGCAFQFVSPYTCSAVRAGSRMPDTVEHPRWFRQSARADSGGVARSGHTVNEREAFAPLADSTGGIPSAKPYFGVILFLSDGSPQGREVPTLARSDGKRNTFTARFSGDFELSPHATIRHWFRGAPVADTSFDSDRPLNKLGEWDPG